MLESAELRRAEGRLEFHDLLVLARDLLRRDPEVRADLQERFERLLLDEFQDTDPIQIELAVRIAGGAEADATDWHDVEVPEGRLFVVGDPKQSIYRFRRANIATYLTAQQLLGETVALTTNFRTVPPILGWINTVFATLIQAHESAQPSYQSLSPHRTNPTKPTRPPTVPSAPPPDAPVKGDQLSIFDEPTLFDSTDSEDQVSDLAAVLPFRRRGADVPPEPSPDEDPSAGPAVTVLGATPHDDLPRAQASVLREREATDVASVIEEALREGWLVYDDRAETWRPAEAGDIAVLVPARTSLPFLEDALDRADIPYRAEASSLVYQTAEVRDLLACARALGDPSDQLALVTALRSPLFGCGDDDLYTWKRNGGTFTLTAPVPDQLLAHPIGEAMEWLRRTYYAARWLTPSEVLAKIVADRRMLEVAAIGPRARDAWRRIRFVVDQARAWSEVEHGGLRSYLAWAAHQGEETSRVAEAVLPETDADAVRVMTIHAAKGLEFPIVILSGMTASPNRQRGVQVLWPLPGGYAVKLKSSVQTEDFDLVQPVDEQMDDYERRRLLYVAATRARDHLVVSLHRSGNRRHTSNAELLATAGGVDAPHATLFTGPPVPDREPTGSPDVTPPISRTEWESRASAAQAASRARSAQSASGLEGTGPELSVAAGTDEGLAAIDPGTAKGARDLELPPWSKGRYGTAIGRAVHAVLQVVDLTTGAGLEAAVSTQCLAEGVLEYADVVTALVRSALASDVVQARRRPRTLARVVRRHGPAGRHRPRGFRRPHLPRGRRPPHHRRLQNRRHPRRRPGQPSRVLRAPAPRVRRDPPEHGPARPPLPQPQRRNRPPGALGNNPDRQYDDQGSRRQRGHQSPQRSGEQPPEQRATAREQQLPTGRRHERRHHEHDPLANSRDARTAKHERREVDHRPRVQHRHPEHPEVRRPRPDRCLLLQRNDPPLAIPPYRLGRPHHRQPDQHHNRCPPQRPNDRHQQRSQHGPGPRSHRRRHTISRSNPERRKRPDPQRTPRRQRNQIGPDRPDRHSNPIPSQQPRDHHPDHN